MNAPAGDGAPLADWRDARAYPAADGSTLVARWHWEFLRRNQAYRRDFERFRALSWAVPDEAAERVRIARRHGLDDLMLDYRCPFPELFQSPRDPDKVRLVRWETQWGEDDDGRRVQRDPGANDSSDPRIRQHEIAVVFDMRHPLEGQLARARDRLEHEQRRHRERRGNVADYVLYLRVWDAEAAGIEPQELARTLFPDVRPALALRRVEAARQAVGRLVAADYRFV